MTDDPEEIWNRAVPVAQARARRNFMANPDYVAPRLRFTEPITLNDSMIAERPWLVNGWLPLGNVTMLSGDGGVGKTLLSQMLATCCAIGRDWLGLPTTPCRALAVFCEDDENEIRRRQRDINTFLGVDWGDLENFKWISRVGDDNALMHWPDRYENAGQPTTLFQSIHNEAQDFGARLVVLDSLHDLFSGNENSRVHARQFIQLVASLARDCDGSVLLNAHPSMSGRNTGTGEAGSTAWNNAVRSRLYFTRPRADDESGGDRDTRTLRRMKSNYSGIGAEVVVTWQEGVFIAHPEPTGALAAIEARAHETAFMTCLDVVTTREQYVTSAKNSDRYAPKAFLRMPEAGGTKLKQLARAMENLLAADKIRLGSVKGPDRHPVKAIIRTVGRDG